MRGGLLRHLVSLQQQSTTPDSIGQPILTWTEIAKLWADIRFVSGIEAIKAAAPTSISKASIQIRKRAGVTSAMRIVDAAGVVYQILDVLPDMEHRDRINLACQVVQ